MQNELTTRQHTTAAAASPRNFKPLWVVLCGITIVISVVSLGFLLTYSHFVPSVSGDIGAGFERTAGVGPQHVIAHAVGPQSPLSMVGIQDGDQLLLDHPWDDLRPPVAGETFRFTKLSPGPSARLAVLLPTAAPAPRAIYFPISLSSAAQLLILLSGLFILWRSRSTAANMALGMAFVCFGSGFPIWPMSSAAFPYWALAIWAVVTMGPALFLRFAMDYDGRSAEQRNPWNLRLFYVFVIAQALVWGFEVYGTLQNYTFPLAKHVKVISYSLQIIGILWPCYFLARGWMRSRPAERKRSMENSKRDYGMNHWQTALLVGLSNSDAFCAGGYRAVLVSSTLESSALVDDG